MRIGLASWIIQDGNYPNFRTGETYSFALEFYAKAFSTTRPGTRSFTPSGNCHYDISAEVTFRKHDFTVIDFGLPAFQEQMRGVEVGQWIRANVFIGVDPFMYFESWEPSPDVPRIKRRWRVDRIYLETTPRVEVDPKCLVRDDKRFSEVEVSGTDAWHDDGGNADYALECTSVPLDA
ncbi:MAG: hypothetical protein KA788_06245 [Lacunisphaera sp.]|nr:hypothetical protein [Lacunisphaera sp.]